MMVSVGEKINQVASALLQAEVVFGQGTEDAVQEASWLVLHSIDELAILSPDWEQTLTQKQVAQIDDWLSQRINSRQPFAYIVGRAWFGGRLYEVNQSTLIPRSFMVEWIDDAFMPWLSEQMPVHRILDLCCGSGCIGINSAFVFEQAEVVLSDIDADALKVAEKNIVRHQMQDRVQGVKSDLFDNIQGKFDVIICNPPYVSQARMEALPDEFRHEPALALAAGDDGLDILRRLLAQARDYLNDEGMLFIEAGSASLALETAYPDVAFNWLSTTYDETVIFAISAEELDLYQNDFKS